MKTKICRPSQVKVEGGREEQMSLNNLDDALPGSLTKSQKSRMKSWRISKKDFKVVKGQSPPTFLLLSPRANFSSLG